MNHQHNKHENTIVLHAYNLSISDKNFNLLIEEKTQLKLKTHQIKQII